MILESNQSRTSQFHTPQSHILDPSLDYHAQDILSAEQYPVFAKKIIDLRGDRGFVKGHKKPDERKNQIPRYFTPLQHQKLIYSVLGSGNKPFRKGVIVWHRRGGKDRISSALLIREAHKVSGVYYYIFPTYAQGRKALWDTVWSDGTKFIDMIPKTARVDNRDMKIELPNRSIIQVVGSDKVDSIVGTNPRMVVFSEYSLQSPAAWIYLRPILLENKGCALFNFTPRGHNHAYDLVRMALNNLSEWFVQILGYKSTGILTDDDVQKEIDQGMPEEIAQQEYGCSFNATTNGSYFGRYLNANDPAVTYSSELGYTNKLPLFTFWDLGVRDATAIWFIQANPKEDTYHVVDYYENANRGLDHYIDVLNHKQSKEKYIYAAHFAPHDLKKREFSTAKTIKALAKEKGLDLFVVPKLGINDGIENVRNVLPKCVFRSEGNYPERYSGPGRDSAKGYEFGLSALKQYRKEFDDKTLTYKNKPLHDWASNGADAFRYFGVMSDLIMQDRWMPTGEAPGYDPFSRWKNIDGSGWMCG